MDRVKAETLQYQPFLTEKDIGRVKHSLVNFFNLHRPIIIVDEAQDVTPLEWYLLDEINEADTWTILETPGGVPEHERDLAWLRERLA